MIRRPAPASVSFASRWCRAPPPRFLTARHPCLSAPAHGGSAVAPYAQDGRPDLGHVLLTGATGFLGQAMLERLLVDHPATRVTVLIRRRGDVTAAERLAGL